MQVADTGNLDRPSTQSDNELTRRSRQITDFIEEVSVSVVLNVEASAEEETDAEERIDLIEKYLRQGVLTCRAFIDE